MQSNYNIIIFFKKKVNFYLKGTGKAYRHKQGNDIERLKSGGFVHMCFSPLAAKLEDALKGAQTCEELSISVQRSLGGRVLRMVCGVWRRRASGQIQASSLGAGLHSALMTKRENRGEEGGRGGQGDIDPVGGA